MSRRTLDIHDLSEFDRHLPRTRRLLGWFLQSVDLTGRSAELRSVDPQGAIFLGCRFAPGDEQSLRDRGALIFPELPGLPFDPYRGGLYTAADLYAALDAGYPRTPDARINAWYRATGRSGDLAAELAMSLHDHAITDALDEALAAVPPDRVVGVMGGHALQRTDPGYREAVLAARQLARAGRLVLTGGGPGAMEAANLGARLAPHSDEAVDAALALLSTAPGFRPSIEVWATTAAEVARRWPSHGLHGLGVPTWFYGHEPPNLFGDLIAKYFANALREDALLARCRGGIMVLPGAAGTVQEIFQATTENYYASDPGSVAPLVLVDRQHWTSTLPAWPLLQSLAGGRAMESSVHLVDTAADAVTVLTP